MTKDKDTAVGEDVETSRKIIESAFDKGILSRTRRLSAKTLPPSKVMIKAGGKDIVKKSTNRKGRYLLIFNCQLAPAAGKLGTLSKLDTKNPVMYIDFPNGGRLKLFGTLLFPKNKYLVMKMGNKEVICEDVLESMIVFNDSWWVGTMAENPDELQLPWPTELSTTKIHDKFEYQIRTPGGGKGEGDDGDIDKDDEDNDEDVEDDDDGDGDGGEGPSRKGGKKRAPAQQRQAGRPTRAGGAEGRGGKKRPRYAEDSDAIDASSDDSEQIDDEDMVLPTQSQKVPLSQSQKAPPSSRSKPRSAAKKKTKPVYVDDDDDDNSDDGNNLVDFVDNGPPSKQGTLLSFLDNSNKKKERKKKTDDEEEEEEVNLMDSSSSDDDKEEEDCMGSDDDEKEEMDEISEESDYAPSE